MLRSRFSEQFVLSIPTEYDYHYSSPRVAEIMHLIQTLYTEVCDNKLTVDFVDEKDLSGYVVTKEKALKMSMAGVDRAGGAPSSAGPAGGPKRRPSAGDVLSDMANLSVKERTRSPTVMHFAAPGGPKEVTLEDFNLLKVLGKGSFGKVLQVKKKDTGEIFAMKILEKEAVLEKYQLEHTKAERHILEAVQHPFLVGLRFAFQNEAKLYMVLDFLNGGELFFHLKSSGRFSVARSKLYAAEIILALEHLHSLGIIYRDLKPENILMEATGHIRLTDFGLAKEQISDNSSAHTFCGTPEYLAPEVLTSQGHGRAVDWWSLGTLLFQMMAGLPPFYHQNINKMYNNIVKAPLVFPDYFPDLAKDLLTKLLDRNPDTRLGSGPSDAAEIKAHPFWDDVDWAKLLAKEVEAPFKPNVQDASDVQNFDTCFTMEEARDSVVAPLPGGAKKDKKNFDGFTFVPDSALK